MVDSGSGYLNATEDWGSIQSRYIDVYMPYTSDTINRLTSICGKKRGKITGMNFEMLFDESSERMFAHYGPGMLLKDNTIIEFTSDVYVSLGRWPNQPDTTYYTALYYNRQIVNPPNLATIVITQHPEIEPENYMVLHRIIKSGSLSTDLTTTEITPYIYTAASTYFDNTSTGLIGNTVQTAIEELYSIVANRITPPY